MQSRFDSLDKSCGSSSDLGRPSCSDSDVAEARSREIAANVFWGLAGVAAVTTACYYTYRVGASACRHWRVESRHHRSGKVPDLKSHSFSSAILAIPCLCLIAVLAAACSFDSSRLQVPAPPAADGPVGLAPDAVVSEVPGDMAMVRDAPIGTPDALAGAGGSDTPAATGGVGGSDGPTEIGGAKPDDGPMATGGAGGGGGSSGTGGSIVPDAAVEAPDTATGGSDTLAATGGVGGSDGPTEPGGATDAPISTGGAGGFGGSSGTGGSIVPDAAGDASDTADEVGSMAPDGAVEAPGTGDGVVPEARDAGCGDSGQACCPGGTCAAGGCCVANDCVANGVACSAGNICTLGSCLSPASLVASPPSSAFGPVLVGQSSNVTTFTIRNAGQQTSGKIVVTSNNTDFVVQSGSAGDCISGTTTLAASASCAVRVVFAPKRAGPSSAQITVSATPGGSSVVAMSGTGTCPTDQLGDTTGTCVPIAGVTWTQRGTSQAWFSVASSADGTKAVAVVLGGNIYTSVDSGMTWTAQGAVRNWMSVASSGDGTKLVAAVANGYIYTSVDSGVTWTPQPQSTVQSWYAVASSADGTKLVAQIRNGSTYTSADSGATWTQRSAERNPTSVASSADGTKLVAGTWGSYIYTSGDSGVTWTPQPQSTVQNWNSVASSADGTKLIAVVNNGYIYTSSGPVP